MEKDPFKEYIRQAEPDTRDKSYVWRTAIGLQAVDGLTPSRYLVETSGVFDHFQKTGHWVKKPGYWSRKPGHWGTKPGHFLKIL